MHQRPWGERPHFCRRPDGVRRRPRSTVMPVQRRAHCRCLCLVKGQADHTLHSVVPDIACIGIDHGEEGANVSRCSSIDRFGVPLDRIRSLVGPAQPVIGDAAVSSSANREALAIDVEVNNTGPALPSVPRCTAGTAGTPSPLRLLSTAPASTADDLDVQRARARLTHSSAADRVFAPPALAVGGDLFWPGAGPEQPRPGGDRQRAVRPDRLRTPVAGQPANRTYRVLDSRHGHRRPAAADGTRDRTLRLSGCQVLRRF